jgi:hypothetical protein
LSSILKIALRGSRVGLELEWPNSATKTPHIQFGL